MNNIITLDVGGKIFRCNKDLLIMKSQYFEDFFADNKDLPSEPLFIDRSPHIFKHILAFIRDDRYKIQDELENNYLHELDYFGITRKQNNLLDAIAINILITSGVGFHKNYLFYKKVFINMNNVQEILYNYCDEDHLIIKFYINKECCFSISINEKLLKFYRDIKDYHQSSDQIAELLIKFILLKFKY